MPGASHHAARDTAWFALVALIAILVAAIVFDTGQTPIVYVLGEYLTYFVLAAIPLLYVAVALTRGPSRRALALAVVYSAATLVGSWITLSNRYNSGSEGSMDVMYSFMFFWVFKAWMVFLLLYVPAMVRLLIVAWRAYDGMPGRRFRPLLAWALAGVVAFLVIAVISVPLSSSASRGVPEYRVDVVDNAINPLYECLWRAAGPGGEAGFPDSLEGIRHVTYRTYPNLSNAKSYRPECSYQLDEIPHQPFDVRYATSARDSAGRAHAFTLTFVEKTRAGGRPRVVWRDQTGLRYEELLIDGRTDSVRVETGTSLAVFVRTVHLIDEYAEAQGGVPPEHIVSAYRWKNGATPPPGVLALEVGDCSAFADRTASCFEESERVWVYRPVNDPSGVVRSYTRTQHPATYYDNERQQPIPSRTHHRDGTGAMHSFGGFRAATAGDPAPHAREAAQAGDALRLFLQSRARR